MKRLLPLAALLIAGFAGAASAATVRIVAPWRAGQYEGSVVAVRGLAEIRQDTSLLGTEVRIVNAQGRQIFMGFIPRLHEHAFPGVLAFNGREVVMYGVIEMYHSSPATQLLYRDQLRPWPPVR